jgi:hypothetical protein
MAGYTIVNEGSLKNEAFLSKSFTVHIEQGNFSTPGHLLSSLDDGDRYDWRYAMRLVFEPSPYPPEGEWKETFGGRPWEFREFVGRRDKGLDGRGKAMNDVRERGKSVCVVS